MLGTSRIIRAQPQKPDSIFFFRAPNNGEINNKQPAPSRSTTTLNCSVRFSGKSDTTKQQDNNISGGLQNEKVYHADGKNSESKSAGVGVWRADLRGSKNRDKRQYIQVQCTLPLLTNQDYCYMAHALFGLNHPLLVSPRKNVHFRQQEASRKSWLHTGPINGQNMHHPSCYNFTSPRVVIEES